MAAYEPITAPKATPALNIPDSKSTVTVRMIDTTTYGRTAASLVFTPEIPGLDEFVFPSYAFLISHGADGKSRHILFDAGMNKDWESALPPTVIGFVKQYMPFDVKQNVDEILDQDDGKLGIGAKDITDVIWSHHHFDHRGDITKFPSTTKVIWGPGSTAAHLPAYPEKADSSFCEAELQNREVRELEDSEFATRIGGLPAYDFFGDGSFHLLSAPGHTVGHLCGLARVTAAEGSKQATFVLMGGDCCHYTGILRPSEYLPLPKTIPAASGTSFGVSACPGQLFVEQIHPQKDPTQSVLKANPPVNTNPDQALESLSSVRQFDANEDVFVIIAHDKTVLGQIDLYPKTLNDWKAHGWKQEVIWRFCGDFKR